MSKRSILLILVAFSAISATIGSIEKQIKDYNVFNTTLFQKEGRIDLHTPELELKSSLTNLRKNLQSEKSILEQYKLYSSTLAEIQCGHTQIYPNKSVLRSWLGERNSLPIDYYLEGKRLIVSKTDASDYKGIAEGKSFYERKKKISAHSEILTIDNRTIEEMMLGIGKFISSDENLQEFKYFQAAQLFEFYRHLAFPFEKDSIHVKYVSNKDTLEQYFIPGTAPVFSMNNRLVKMTQNWKVINSSFGTFKTIKSKYGYFRFKSFTSAYGRDYEEFLESSFRKMKSSNIDKLVVDLRGNTGGVMQYSIMKYFVGEDVELGRYVVEKLRKRSDSKHISKFQSDYRKHKRMSKKQKRLIRRGNFNEGLIKTDKVNEDLIFKGEVVVITDEGTFSSAAMLACHLKTLSDAKIVGRPAGGSFYAGNSGTLEVKLPQSGFKLFVNPNTFYSHLTPVENPKTIKTPDQYLNPVHMSSKKMDAFYFKSATKMFQ